MSFITKILGGGAGALIDSIGGVIDAVSTTDEERAAAKLEVQKLIHAENQEIEKTVRKELEAKERILVAELQQGDNYTKRARPSIVYAGLLFVLGPMVAKILGQPIDIDSLVPAEFWYAWGGVTGTWVVGRSMEKRGNGNRFSKAVTGSKLLDD
jgi:hypothetical protein